MRVTRSIMIVKPPGYQNGSPPISPAGSTPPVSPFSGKRQVLLFSFHLEMTNIPRLFTSSVRDVCNDFSGKSGAESWDSLEISARVFLSLRGDVCLSVNKS